LQPKVLTTGRNTRVADHLVHRPGTLSKP
jgi:hypothetical protein